MDSQLLWNAHTQKMAAKAQSALTAMNLLSNTMRGITGRHMRILYLGCVIPILTWGAEVWYTSQREGPRLRPLKRVERKGLLRITGAWKPSPTLHLYTTGRHTPTHCPPVKPFKLLLHRENVVSPRVGHVGL